MINCNGIPDGKKSSEKTHLALGITRQAAPDVVTPIAKSSFPSGSTHVPVPIQARTTLVSALLI